MDAQGTNNNDLLAKWISGEISEAELQVLIDSGELDQYARIIEEVDTWSVPPVNLQSSYQKLKSKLRVEETPVVPLSSAVPETKIAPLFRQKWLSIAAGVAIVLGLFSVINALGDSEISHETVFGETLEIQLPDSSTAILLANSTLTYEADWSDHRELHLAGGAYFEVVKGGEFVVATDLGQVQVLGTQFVVNVAPDFMSAQCFEGSVQFSADGAEDAPVLTAGKGARFIAETGLEEFQSEAKEFVKPTTDGVTLFVNSTLREVLYGLTNQYGVTFVDAAPHLDRKYNGGFPNDALEGALELVFGALSIGYEVDGDRIILEN